jgi:hypothetical protein
MYKPDSGKEVLAFVWASNVVSQKGITPMVAALTAWSTRCLPPVWFSAACSARWWCAHTSACHCRSRCQGAKFAPASWCWDSGFLWDPGNWASSLASTAGSSSPWNSPVHRLSHIICHTLTSATQPLSTEFPDWFNISAQVHVLFPYRHISRSSIFTDSV